MSGWAQHLPLLPIVIPLLAGAGMLLFADAQRTPRTIVACAAALANLLAAVGLVDMANRKFPAVIATPPASTARCAPISRSAIQPPGNAARYAPAVYSP